jgi:hypothetical protein
MTKRFYATIRRASGSKIKTGFLAGPYDSLAEAEPHVREATAKAQEADPWASFDAFGVTMADTRDLLTTTFGKL